MPAYGSGLSAQFGYAAESTVGTEVTVSRFLGFLSESLTYEPTWLEPAGLRAGQGFKRASHVGISRHMVSGDVTLEYFDKGGFGLLWKHALGSSATPVQIGATTAYRQIHTPGSKTGLGLTMQIGRPQTNATVQPFTYRGCKISEWEFSVSDGEYPQLSLTVDGWQEATGTALAVASYPTLDVPFTFADASLFRLGGTASTSSGETTVSGGSNVATVVNEFSISGSTGMANERFGLGNSGVKREQIENDIPTITGSLGGEFTLRSEIYDQYKANNTVPLQLDFSHGNAGGGNAYLLSFIIPAAKFKTAGVNADGPDILAQSIDFEGYDDGVNPVIQIKLVSTDTTL